MYFNLLLSDFRFNEYEKKLNPYEMGKDFFGKYGSGKGNLSETYKEKVREKINEKMSH
jgi:hypothetical protein